MRDRRLSVAAIQVQAGPGAVAALGPAPPSLTSGHTLMAIVYLIVLRLGHQRQGQAIAFPAFQRCGRVPALICINVAGDSERSETSTRQPIDKPIHVNLVRLLGDLPS